MADGTHIEWTDATWNPITGCSVVSPGCTNCYAMKLAGTRLKHTDSRKDLTMPSKSGPVWNGQVRLNEEWMLQPLNWKRPRMIFVCAHGDLFAENVPDKWIDRVFAVMALSPQHTFQVLTKRPERMKAYLTRPRWRPVLDYGQDEPPSYWIAHAMEHLACRLPSVRATIPDHVSTFGKLADFKNSIIREDGRVWPLPNVWLGVSVEDQKRADERIPLLMKTPASIRWISAEPLLGGIDFERILFFRNYYESGANHYVDVLRGGFWSSKPMFRPSQDGEGKNWFTNHGDIKDSLINWIVAGGESGPHARPMHPAWVRSIRDQCRAAGVPFFFKQWGNWISVLDRDKDDPDWRADYSGRFHDRHSNIRWLNLAGGTGFHGEQFHIMKRASKQASGRMLDGVLHDAFPKTERTI